MLITVACGAISGFHATQSPLMARCLTREKDGRNVFYGAMIMESVTALVWAAAGVAFYESSAALSGAMAVGGQSGVVYAISTSLMGKVGGLLAVIGVVVCPPPSAPPVSPWRILSTWSRSPSASGCCSPSPCWLWTLC